MDIKGVYGSYKKLFPEERLSLEKLETQIFDGGNLVSRKNFNGHVTASGLVICPNGEKVLMIFHKGLKMYIQPGGHLEEVDITLVEAAIREVKEETGLVHFRLHYWCQTNNSPLLIDTHKIPANAKKDELEHYHHDFMYLFIADDMNLDFDELEVDDAKWVSLKELVELEDAVGKAVRRYLKEIL